MKRGFDSLRPHQVLSRGGCLHQEPDGPLKWFEGCFDRSCKLIKDLHDSGEPQNYPMKLKNTLLTLVVATLFSGAAFAADPAPVAKKAGCCVKAEKAGHECDHECCVAAAKDGKNCEKCGGAGAVTKK
jgi:hypothetical protein